jgi:hypothetical protein
LSAPLDASYIRKLAKKTIPKVLRFYRVDPEVRWTVEMRPLEQRGGFARANQRYLEAVIQIDPSTEWTEEECYLTIVHEACHIAVAECNDSLERAMDSVPAETQNIHRLYYVDAVERLTERLARVYTGLHPLKEVVV